jgi:hypothetical protein
MEEFGITISPSKDGGNGNKWCKNSQNTEGSLSNESDPLIF